jgi:hypothetical protein
MRGRGVYEIREILILGIIYFVLYCKEVRNYVIYDVPTQPHKTRRQSHTLFSIYTFENSSLRQRGHQANWHKY